PTAADQAPSVEETEPFETDESTATPPPPPAYRTIARISIPAPVMSLRTTVVGQMSEIRELQATDRMRQIVISELLRINHRRSTEISELRTALQGQVTAL
nr:hypothetical protein [Tanacetum cinerariifolium]